jgi:predicted nucleic acid-binding Zn ribbon protein
VNEQWVAEAELVKRVDARRASRGVRQHVRCVRCRKAIPASKRADAKYCSEKCKRQYNPEQRYKLQREIRVIARAGKIVPHCIDCGAPLEMRVRPGPVPTRCLRCYNAMKQREHRAKLTEA